MTNIVLGAITLAPLGNSISALVNGIDLREPISPAIKDQIVAAWMRHMVLRFYSQQDMST